MRTRINKTLLNAAVANGVGEVDLISDCRHAVIAIDGADSPNLTIKIVGSMADEMPNFAAAQSPDNQWDYLQGKDLEDGSSVDGDVGITFSGTADNRQIEINTNLVRWVSVVVSGYVAGEVTARLLGSSD